MLGRYPLCNTSECLQKDNEPNIVWIACLADLLSQLYAELPLMSHLISTCFKSKLINKKIYYFTLK